MVKKSVWVVSFLSLFSGVYTISFVMNIFPKIMALSIFISYGKWILFLAGVFSLFFGLYYFWKNKDSMGGMGSF